MAKIKNKGFFNSPRTPDAGEAPFQAADAPRSSNRVQLRTRMTEDIKNTIAILQTMGMGAQAAAVANFGAKVNDDRFSVAVVGEFSRGKSTLVNALLERDVLPVGTLPTTALLTRITYGAKEEMTVIGADGKVRDKLPLSSESWDGLVASNFGEAEPDGRVAITLRNNWLHHSGIAIFDTPGAGDTEEKRARVIGRTLTGADSALITISATSPVSLTEINFIEQRVMAARVPYVAVVITRLDEVPLQERDSQVNYIIKRLKAAHLNVPVLIGASELQMPSDLHTSRIGLDSLRNMIDSWRNDENRNRLVEDWLLANVLQTLRLADTVLDRRAELLAAKEEEREQLIASRKSALHEQHERWEALRRELQVRADACVARFHEKTLEVSDAIIERLQHEVDHQASARTWVEKDYAYRVKTELAAASHTLDAFVTRTIASDLQWLNSNLNHDFRTLVKAPATQVESKDLFSGNVSEDVRGMEDLQAGKVKTTVLITGLSLGAAALFMATGGLAMLGTMGVGTGANILAGKVFNRKAEEQRNTVKELVGTEVPRIVRDAAADSDVRIRIIYADILGETRRTEAAWMQAQGEEIELSTPSRTAEATRTLAEDRDKIRLLRERFMTYTD